MRLRKELVVVFTLVILLQFYFYLHGYFDVNRDQGIVARALLPPPVRTSLITAAVVIPVYAIFLLFRSVKWRNKK